MGFMAIFGAIIIAFAINKAIEQENPVSVEIKNFRYAF